MNTSPYIQKDSIWVSKNLKNLVKIIDIIPWHLKDIQGKNMSLLDIKYQYVNGHTKEAHYIIQGASFLRLFSLASQEQIEKINRLDIEDLLL